MIAKESVIFYEEACCGGNSYFCLGQKFGESDRRFDEINRNIKRGFSFCGLIAEENEGCYWGRFAFAKTLEELEKHNAKYL